jgi:hypothetical protein
LIGIINGAPAREHFIARFLEDAGFVNTTMGFQMRRTSPIPLPAPAETAVSESEADDPEDVSESA